MEDILKKLIIIALTTLGALTAIAATTTTADAAQGCGAGFHRGAYGACRPNVAPRPRYVAPGAVVVVPGGPRAGVYYRGRGYWDGNRYWGNRVRRGGGWRYY
jgi:hypothetical protein